MRTVALLYIAVLVLVPVVILFYRTFQPGLSSFFSALSDPYAQHAFEVTFIVGAWAVAINTLFGVAIAMLLARHDFPGKSLLNAFIDLPVAVSPIVVGLAFVLVFGTGGWFGSAFGSGPLQIIGAKPGMVLVTVFLSLPLVVRAVIPVLEQAGTDQEKAANSLGASWFTTFRRITLPIIRPALSYGVVLCTARCIGEYGAVLVVSNNLLGQTETAPLHVYNEIVQNQDTNAAYAVAFVLVLIAFAAILLSAYIRKRQAR
ncbi:MAG: sulfate ABC transporter permease [Jatrophihabitans endophyticus]|nr:sulfate ABC transporter permease [Jatrophihabitans endophyticus]